VPPGEWYVLLLSYPFETETQLCTPCRSIGDGYMPGFRAVCTIRANLSGVERGLEQMISPTGKKYWRVQFEVEIFFGLTALAACIVWKEGVRLLF